MSSRKHTKILNKKGRKNTKQQWKYKAIKYVYNNKQQCSKHYIKMGWIYKVRKWNDTIALLVIHCVSTKNLKAKNIIKIFYLRFREKQPLIFKYEWRSACTVFVFGFLLHPPRILVNARYHTKSIIPYQTFSRQRLLNMSIPHELFRT